MFYGTRFHLTCELIVSFISDNLGLRLEGNPLVWDKQTYWMEVGRNQGWLTLDVDQKYGYQLESGNTSIDR